VARARAKVEAWGVSNVEIHQGRAEALPFGDASVDLVVSNNGLNNVQDLDKALAECARVCKPGAQFLFTWNLPETMATVYDAMEDILGRLGLHDAVTDLRRHIFDKRKPVEWMRERAVAAGFTVRRVEEKSFVWRFASPEALMAHGFMRLAFIPAWVEIIPAPHRPAVLDELARRLEVVCARGGEIALGIPYACVDCTR
jgi:SAM-dependent methyltransferase